jgi:predicted DNA-binding transcriptional regulator AlpA
MLESREARLLHAFSKALHDLSTEYERLAEEAVDVLAKPIAQATTPAPPEHPDRRDKTAPDRPLLNERDLVEWLGVSRVTLWKWRRRDATFPRPLILGTSVMRWRREEVEQWLGSDLGGDRLGIASAPEAWASGSPSVIAFCSKDYPSQSESPKWASTSGRA